MSMLLKAGALALVSVPLGSYPANHPMVEQVRCDQGSGTAFQIDGRYVSVNHVTAMSGCKIAGKPVMVTYAEQGGDFSIADRVGLGGLKVDCSGFRDGHWYFAIGYARGLPTQTMVVLRASKATTRTVDRDGYYILTGRPTVIPGMSGGPILNAAGEVVGTINAYNPMFGLSHSRELKGTPLCR